MFLVIIGCWAATTAVVVVVVLPASLCVEIVIAVISIGDWNERILFFGSVVVVAVLGPRCSTDDVAVGI